MRRLLFILLWIVKTVLLGAALAAVVLWPVSCGQLTGVYAQRYTMGPGWGEYRKCTAGCWDGRVVIGRYWMHVSGEPGLAFIRDMVASGGEGWRWDRGSEAGSWDEGDWPGRWGLLRWNVTDDKVPLVTYARRNFAAPLWMLALFAGTWPVASIVLTIRRRRRQSRAARVGCCQRCGYDLRASPDRCPECGFVTSKAKS
jgi:hypothetical protein